MMSSITCVKAFRVDPNSRSKALSSSGSVRRRFSTPANLEVSVPNKWLPAKSLRHLARLASMAATALSEDSLRELLEPSKYWRME